MHLLSFGLGVKTLLPESRYWLHSDGTGIRSPFPKNVLTFEAFLD